MIGYEDCVLIVTPQLSTQPTIVYSTMCLLI